MIPVAAGLAIAVKIEKALLAKMTMADVAELCGVTVKEVEEVAARIRARREKPNEHCDGK